MSSWFVRIQIHYRGRHTTTDRRALYGIKMPQRERDCSIAIHPSIWSRGSHMVLVAAGYCCYCVYVHDRICVAWNELSKHAINVYTLYEPNYIAFLKFSGTTHALVQRQDRSGFRSSRSRHVRGRTQLQFVNKKDYLKLYCFAKSNNNKYIVE